jgi:hypothetical protein
MMSTLKELEARSSETRAIAFQHLLLLVGLHIFKVLSSIEKGTVGLPQLSGFGGGSGTWRLKLNFLSQFSPA